MKPRRRPTQPKRTNPAASALVQIEKPIYGGAFLARIEGKATFVPLTLPGEEARVRVVEQKRSYASAEPEEIVASSPDRVVPACPHFGSCGGCNYQHATYEAQLGLKEAILRETLERARIPVPKKIDVLAGNPWQYRNRIRLAFDAAGRIGYRGRRSHEIVSIHECPIAAPCLVNAAQAAADLQREIGEIRLTEISLFCNAQETEVLASVFLRDPLNAPALDRFARRWHERVAPLTGVEFVIATDQARDCRVLHSWGERSLTYRVGEIDYRVDQGAFFQVNRWLLDEFVDRVIGNRAGALAWDLFAGVGLFARRLVAAFDQVDAVESAPSAIPALAANLKGTNGVCTQAETLQFLKKQRGASRPDLVLVDPPRAGLGPETTSLLADIAAPHIAYISCDPATLARDLRALLPAGYAIQSVTLADLFPHTFHLETLVEIERC